MRRLTSVSVALRIVAVAILLMVAAVAWYEIASGRDAVILDTEREIARLDMVFSEQTGRAVEAVDLLVGGVMETVRVRLSQGLAMDGMGDRVRRRIHDVRQLSAITVVDRDGAVLLASESSRTYAPQAVVAGLLARYRDDPKVGLLISPPFRVADEKWNVLLARPMLDPDGALLGVAMGSIALSYFEDFYRTVDLNENGIINLYLRDGTALARFPHIDRLIGTSFGDTPPFKQILANAPAGTMLTPSPVDESRRVLAIRAVRAFPLAVMVSVSQDRVLADWRRAAVALIAGTVLASGLVAVLLLSLARRSTQVERLLAEARGARSVAEQASDRLLRQIAERERAEGALRQAQRIEAVGQLTGGVAHDFNNLLTVVLGNVEILQRREVAGDGAVAARLAAIRSAAERGATLTRHLLAFARRQPLMPKPVDLNRTIRGMRDLLDSALGMRGHVELRLAADLAPAMVDQGQIELMILNLAINAREAMPEGGVVTIETTNHCQIECGGPDGPVAGDYVRVTVRDTGVGMPPEILGRVFEPFFTTKPAGTASGLGLSQVFGTARQSGGGVRIDSEVGSGTSVIVDLPRAKADAARPGAGPILAPWQGSPATILLVDDNDAVRVASGAMLRDLGYNVREAPGGEEALRILRQYTGADILMTDLVMPGMNGQQLAVAAKALQPNIQVIFMSGYADQLGDERGLDHCMVRKPFGAAELHQAIEAELLARRGPRRAIA